MRTQLFGTAVVLFACIFLSTFFVCGQAAANPYSYTTSDGKFHLDWKITGTTIFFNMSAVTTGWLSFGICDSTAMAPADMYTGWITSAGTVVILDTWSPDYNEPRLDTADGGANNVQTPTGVQTATTTTLSFTRLLDTGDTNTDMPVQDKDVYILWAMNPNDGDANYNYPEHTVYGSQAVNFVKGMSTGGDGTPVASPGGADPTGNAKWTSSDGKFTLTWQISSDQKTILFKMAAATTGWISFGISMDGSGKMTNADCYTGWVDDTSGLVVLMDTFSPDYNQPRLDSTNGGTEDLTLVNAVQSNGQTSITFSRPMTTSDTANDAELKPGFFKVMYAMCPTDGSGTSYPIHTVYSQGSINFFTGQSTNDGGLSPGQKLVIIVVCIMFGYLVIRFSYKLRKVYVKRQKKQARILAKTQSTRSVAMDVDYNKPKAHRAGYNNGAYYRGSTQFSKSPVPEDYDVDLGKEEKSIGSKRGNQIMGFFNKRIPRTSISYLSIIVAVLFVLVNIACLWQTDADWYKRIGSLVAGNSFLVALPATRNSIMVLLFHIPFDKTIQYHRWIGMWIVMLTTVHFIWTYIYWQQTAQPILTQQKLLSNIYGLVGWGVVVAMFFSSLEPIRRKKFEAFYYTHFLFLAFYVFGTLHSSKFMPFMIAAGVFYVLDRLLRVVWGIVPKKTTYIRIKDAQDPRDKVVQMRFPKNTLARYLKLYKVGQYVFVNFPTLGLLEWHPFSISSGPDETTLEIHVKGLGDHTQKLVKLAAEKPAFWVRVDGPYGHLKLNYRRFPVLVLVGGGIGMTPIMGILRDMFRIGEIDPLAKKHKHCVEAVYLIWTVQNEDQYCWFVDELNEVWNGSQRPGMPKFVPSIFVTRIDDKAQIDPNYIRQRPDFDGFFDSIVSAHPKRATTVFACGPKEMIKTCWDCVNERNRNGNKLIYHHETFDF